MMNVQNTPFSQKHPGVIFHTPIMFTTYWYSILAKHQKQFTISLITIFCYFSCFWWWNVYEWWIRDVRV